VIAISSWTKNQVVARYGIAQEKIDVLYNWVRPACLLPISGGEISRVRERYKLPGRYIAYLGGYRAYKNVEFLMKAWALVRHQPLCPPLVLAGQIPRDTEGGYYCDVLGTAKRLGLAGNTLILPGIIADEDLPAFYAGASLFLSPSRLEGFGYPAAEAMACGVPILVSDESVYPELIPEKHLRFSIHDTAELADLMLSVLSDPQHYIRPIDPRFTEASGKIRYEEIIREVAGSGLFSLYSNRLSVFCGAAKMNAPKDGSDKRTRLLID
jgi:glycosyltransferase involved in cell wall biosynthesis